MALFNSEIISTVEVKGFNIIPTKADGAPSRELIRHPTLLPSLIAQKMKFLQSPRRGRVSQENSLLDISFLKKK